jgi:hypothetical protein
VHAGRLILAFQLVRIGQLKENKPVRFVSEVETALPTCRLLAARIETWLRADPSLSHVAGLTIDHFARKVLGLPLVVRLVKKDEQPFRLHGTFRSLRLDRSL